jgi:orotate phosphoribosyltransferase-like protein
MTADEIAAAFGKVDELLVAATAAAPAVALLAARAAERGISEAKLAAHLHLNATTMRWVLKLEPAAATDRSIDLEAADTDLGELMLRWARS